MTTNLLSYLSCTRSNLAFLLYFIVSVAAIDAQNNPYMIKDIDNSIYPYFSSYPTNIVNIGSIVYFQATESGHGAELWKSDGTEGGTVLVKDLEVGAIGSDPGNLTNVGGTLYFTTGTTSTGAGRKLWKTDGTAAGTVLLRDNSLNTTFSYLTDVNGTLFFVTSEFNNGTEVWKTDGTVVGTVLVKRINPSGSAYPSGLTNVNGTLFFRANDGIRGYELWKSDGTEGGTVLVKDINSGPNDGGVFRLTNANGILYFAANNGLGSTIWKSDGTERGTVSVSSKCSISSTINSLSFVYANGLVFFKGSDATNGEQLWKTDGTDAGTVKLTQLTAIANPLRKVGNTLFFTANANAVTTNTAQLWKSDGTTTGTVLVKSGGQVSAFSNLTNFGGVLYFAFDRDSIQQTELWKSDGSANGTVLVKDIYPGKTGSLPANMVDANGVLFFTATHDKTGRELWKSSGTDATTLLVKDIYGSSRGSLPANFVNMNGTVYFTATEINSGTELWKTNGTAASTVLVKDIYPGFKSSSPSNLTNVNGVLFFSASDSIHGTELWKSDGTEMGTVLVKDIYPGTDRSSGAAVGSSIPYNFINLNGILYFVALEQTLRQTLWKSDGTETGTVRAVDKTNYEGTINVNGVFYFKAHVVNEFKLFKSNGTDATTELVQNVPSGVGWELPTNFVDVGGILFFTLTNAASLELWKIDTTTGGAVLVKNDLGGTTVYSSTSVGSNLYFYNSRGLWKSDGTTAGTILVKASGNGFISQLINFNGVLYFSVRTYNFTTGFEGADLWKSDGTVNGTVLVKVIYKDTYSTQMNYLTNVNGTLYFNTAIEGLDLWKSDGTEAGTRLVKNIYGGGYLSFEERPTLTNAGGELFISTHYVNVDGFDYGKELWRLGNVIRANRIVKNTGRTRTFNTEKQTSPTTMTCFGDVSNNLIITVDAIGNNPISDTMDAKVWIDSTQSALYVKRHYEITPASNAATATGRVTLYFTQAEFDAFNAVNTKKLPTNANDAVGIANLKIDKRGGTSSNETGLPTTYSGTSTSIDPVDTDIIWNASDDRWEVTFDVTGFSGFFVTTSAAVIPVELVNFSGKNTEGGNLLTWTTASEVNSSHFVIERKTNESWVNLNAVKANGKGSNYSFMDKTPPAGINYYRLSMVDNDGKTEYSKIIALRNTYILRGLLTIYPNPVYTVLTIETAENSHFDIFNLLGQCVISGQTAAHQINVSALSQGTYMLKVGLQQVKFVKQ